MGGRLGGIVIFTASRLEASARLTRLRGKKAIAAETVFFTVTQCITRDKESLKTSLKQRKREKETFLSRSRLISLFLFLFQVSTNNQPNPISRSVVPRGDRASDFVCRDGTRDGA